MTRRSDVTCNTTAARSDRIQHMSTVYTSQRAVLRKSSSYISYLCSCNLQQCDTTHRTPLGELTALSQTRPPGWIWGSERKGKRERKGKGKGDGERRGKKNGSGSEKRGRKEKGTKGREGGGRKEKGRNLCSCDFSLGKSLLHVNNGQHLSRSFDNY